MTRYFYNDPLKAAWMVKHHGMQFEDKKLLIERLEGDLVLLALPVFVNDMRPNSHFYIHPDSLHLLTPEPTDIVRIGTFFTDWGSFHLAGTGKVIATRHGDIQDFTIIQRNGLAFHWPESEAA